jgi:hypothetical protein
MLNFLLVTINIILTGVAGYLLLRRKSRFTPEWQKAVWYLLLILALYAVQEVWGYWQHEVGTGVQVLNLVYSTLVFLATYMGSETVMLAVRGDDTYLDSLLGLLAHIKGFGRSMVAGVKDKLEDKGAGR